MSDLLLDTQQAFDSIAQEYDGVSGNNALIQRMRNRLMLTIKQNIPYGQHLLDLGCGTGLDAQYLAQAGYRITAMDWSEQMVQRTKTRIVNADLQDRVETKHLGFHQIHELKPERFDAAYSDLGALNCIEHMDDFAESLFGLIRSNGKMVVSVIGRICPWEWMLYISKRQWQRARLRAAREMVPVPLNGKTVWTHYFAPGEFAHSFIKAGFQLVSVRALGLFVPPPYMIGFAERHAGVVNFLQQLDDRFGAWPILRGWGDHFLLVMQRRD